MDASKEGVNGPDSISSSFASMFSAGPRLPQELVNLIIEHLYDDPKALQQCCLASTILHTTAQRLLFREVGIILARDQAEIDTHHGYNPRNLERVLEFYSSFPLARHARDLVITGSGSVAPNIDNFPLLQMVVTLLSTCQQNIPDIVVSTMPTSRISSLSMYRIFGPAAAFARILRAFPRLETLSFSRIRPESSSPEEMSIATASSLSLPRLQALQFESTRHSWRLLSALFPDGVNVHLRSFSGDEESAERVWGTILERAGRHLQELTLTQVTQQNMPDAVAFDLTTNTRLKRVTLVSSEFENKSFPGWALSTLRGITSENLEEVTLQWQYSEKNTPQGDRTACLALDEELVRRSQGLRRITIKYEVYKKLAAAQDFFAKSFSRCSALGILHIESTVHRQAPYKRLETRL